MLADGTEIDTPAPTADTNTKTGLHTTAPLSTATATTATPGKGTVASTISGGSHSEVERIINTFHGEKVAYSRLPDHDYHKDSTKRHKSVPMNQPSIVCMLLSTDKDRAVDAFHFLGGDALWDVEASVADWLVPLTDGDGKAVKVDRWTADIPLMKASQ